MRSTRRSNTLAPFARTRRSEARAGLRAVIGSATLDGVAGAIAFDSVAAQVYTGPVSWTLWARVNGTDASLRMFVAINTSAKQNVLLHRIAGSASTSSFFGFTTAITGTTHASTSCVDDVWHHHAVTWDVGGDDKIRYYLDGVIQFTSAAYTAATLAADDYWTVGAEYDPGNPLGDFLDGKIGRLSVFGRVLSQAEVTRLWRAESPTTPREMGAVAMYLPGTAATTLTTIDSLAGATSLAATATGIAASDITTDSPT